MKSEQLVKQFFLKSVLVVILSAPQNIWQTRFTHTKSFQKIPKQLRERRKITRIMCTK